MPTIDIEWLTPDGAGGARVEGGTLRVPGTLPGDRVRYTPIGRRGRSTSGLLEEILVPSPERRSPPCPWSTRCGGCDLSTMEPNARHRALRTIVQRAFRWPDTPEILPSPLPTAHRARIKLGVDGARVGYRAQGSHDLVEIGTCGVARPEIRAAIPRLRAVLEAHRTPLSTIESVELRSDGERVVYSFRSAGPVPTEPLGMLGDVALGGRAIHGDPVLWLPQGPIPLRASPLSFYQVNLEANARLVERITERVHGWSPERVLDLYSGNGNLSLPLASEGIPIVAVELEGQSLHDLDAAAARAGISDRITTIPRAAEHFDPSRVAFDVVLLDPPRAGAPGVLSRVVRNRPRGIVYVACNPQAAARDVREATKAGYRPVELFCVDMFPDTHHVESVIVLER